MKRLIIYLIRKRLGLKKFQTFRFANQKDDATYYFTTHELRKIKVIGDGENSYMVGTRSNVSLNWVLDDDCKVDILKNDRE